MKKIRNIIMLLGVAFLLTGCVKFNVNMDIKKDKSMDFSIIYAMNSSLLNGEKLLEESDKQELEKQGFTISDYNEDNMQGFKLIRKIKNIDEVSTDSDTSYSLSGLLNNTNTNESIFKVKKGLLKNTYTATLVFNAEDSDLDVNQNEGSSNDEIDSESDYDYETDFNYETDFGTDEGSDFLTDSMGDLDFSAAMSNMNLSFKVNLPYKVLSNNATSISDDNKTLSWDLKTDGIEEIKFEFELYNMMLIYLGIGIIALVVIAILLFMGKGHKKVKTNLEGNVEALSNQEENLNMNTEMPLTNLQDATVLTNNPNNITNEGVANEFVLNNNSTTNTTSTSEGIVNDSGLDIGATIITPVTPTDVVNTPTLDNDTGVNISSIPTDTVNASALDNHTVINETVTPADVVNEAIVNEGETEPKKEFPDLTESIKVVDSEDQDLN